LNLNPILKPRYLFVLIDRHGVASQLLLQRVLDRVPGSGEDAELPEVLEVVRDLAEASVDVQVVLKEG